MNSFCGPYALGFVLGINPDEAAARVRFVRQDSKPVTGVYNREVSAVLRDCGVKFERFHFGSDKLGIQVAEDIRIKGRSFGWVMRTELGPKRPTVARWLRSRDRSKLYILQLAAHYIVVVGNKIYDTLYQNGVWIRQYGHRRARVRSGWKMERQGRGKR